MEDKNRIIIFDTTMRDDEQSPGAQDSGLRRRPEAGNSEAQLLPAVLEEGGDRAGGGLFAEHPGGRSREHKEIWW